MHSLAFDRIDQVKMVALMLGSTLLIERSVVLEIQQNLDNCIGESGKTKHLIEAR